VDVLVERAAVRGQRVAELAHGPLPRLDERGRVGGVRRSREAVEAGRVRGVVGLERDVADPAAEVEARAGRHRVACAVGDDDAVRTDVDDADLAVVEELFAADLRHGLERERRIGRHGADRDHAVVVGDDGAHAAGDEEVLDEVALTQLLLGGARDLLGRCGAVNGGHGVSFRWGSEQAHEAGEPQGQLGDEDDDEQQRGQYEQERHQLDDDRLELHLRDLGADEQHGC
jgi:hypothetical protein